MATTLRRLALILLAASCVGFLAQARQPEPSAAPSPSTTSGSPSATTPASPSGSPSETTDHVAYSNDFEGPVGTTYPEWSSTPIASVGPTSADANKSASAPSGSPDKAAPTSPDKSAAAPTVLNVDSPNKTRRFLGPFGGPEVDPAGKTRVDQTVRLSIKDLGLHTRVTVAFDLLVINSWDGNNSGWGPDRWSLSVVDGPTLLETTFSNIESTQDYPVSGSPPRTGSVAQNSLGYTYRGDSTYRLSFTFPHEADALELDFHSSLFEGRGFANEGWGLDNVSVSIDLQESRPLASLGRAFSPLVQGDDPAQFESVGLVSGSVLIRDGEIRLSGEPKGYIATRQAYKDYVLQFEWSYERPRGLKPGNRFDGNSGVLFHIVGPPKIWPSGVKLQVWHQASSGDFSTFGVAKFEPEKDLHEILSKLLKPVGQWNRFEITCRGDSVTLRVNGMEIARGSGVRPSQGQIGLMSEGSPIRYRNLRIKRAE